MTQPLRPAATRRRLVLAFAISQALSLPALAADPPADAEAAGQRTPTTLDSLVVTGARVAEADIAIGTDQVRNTIAIDHEALLSAPAGISGLKMLESLPGFNVQANDALGLYEFGNSVFVRAFGFRQIGFVLDGIPLGRSDQFGGSPVFRYVDNENTWRVTASQGAGDVSAPSYASLGPIVQYQSLAPAEEAGVQLSQTFGSDDLNRSFVKLESGEHGGFSGYLSRSKIDSQLWRGPGTIDREHIEGKARYRWDSGSLDFKVVHNDFFDYDTPSINKAQYLGTANDAFGRQGRYFGYLGYVPSLAPSVAGIAYSNTGYNQYYQQAINQRTDTLYGLNGLFVLSPDLELRSTLYYEDKDGYGVSPEAYATSLASHNAQRAIVPGLYAPLGLQYGLSTVAGTRQGALAALTWQVGAHSIDAGAWRERDRYHRTQARYNQVGGNPAGQPLLDQPVHLQRDFWSTRTSTQLHLKDTWRLLDDRLALEFGAKALDLEYEIEGQRNPADYIAGRRPLIRDRWKDGFLPQAGAVYSFGREQLFASWSQTLALPQGADDIYSQASPAAPGPEAETAENLELGLRSNRGTFNGVLALYASRFDDRLQSYASPVPGSGTTETFFQNVGAVEAWGAEASGIWKPRALGDRVAFNGNLSWNRAEFKDDFSTFAIAGNRVPDSPQWLSQAGVTWEAGRWGVLNLSGRYVGQRYSNYVNTESVGGYAVWNAYVDLGGEAFEGLLRNARLRFNVDNLFDRDYLGTINPVVSGPATYRPGPDRTWQVSLSIAL